MSCHEKLKKDQRYKLILLCVVGAIALILIIIGFIPVWLDPKSGVPIGELEAIGITMLSSTLTYAITDKPKEIIEVEKEAGDKNERDV